jgi:Family of unknown function (DUF6353)
MKILPASTIAKLSRKTLILKKNSPHIFFAAGVAGSIASTVLACRATLKLSATLDEIQSDIALLKPRVDHPELTTESLTTEDAVVEHTKTIYVYVHSSLKIVKLYGPAILLGAASIGLLTGSHVQMTRRNSALMAAYAAVAKAYDDYRERVREELGVEKELDIYHAAKTEIVKDADGNEIKGKVADPNKYSPYAKFFDEYSDEWKRDPELNRMFVQCQQNYLNDRLKAYGHVFLNEAYDCLGIPRTSAGAVVGWLKEGDGDGYVDFGIFEAFNARFVNGPEQSILLDFNVDGVIYDKI